ncbi:hypothetical protein LCGC14_1923190 [marine sediment metagenome]|uniref:Uncharacterized protein n=1 Tax=marine sediment metagenome TaxID=412755 RepID=A0A0F9FQY1_9ZZZZ
MWSSDNGPTYLALGILTLIIIFLALCGCSLLRTSHPDLVEAQCIQEFLYVIHPLESSGTVKCTILAIDSVSVTGLVKEPGWHPHEEQTHVFVRSPSVNYWVPAGSLTRHLRGYPQL